MGVDKEQSVRDLLRAMERCSTAATIHKLANARHALSSAFELYQNESQDPALRILLDEAIRNALEELATAVWSRRHPCG